MITGTATIMGITIITIMTSVGLGALPLPIWGEGWGEGVTGRAERPPLTPLPFLWEMEQTEPAVPESRP